jgi:hypothetical protein
MFKLDAFEDVSSAAESLNVFDTLFYLQFGVRRILLFS